MEIFVRQPAEPFVNPNVTSGGSPRAHVAPVRLQTLWINTGTLCNLSCQSCYIESTPRNDRLSYLDRAEVAELLEQVRALDHGTRTIGFTGGEPFMNPDIAGMLEDCLAAGYEVLVLTNAMKPMQKLQRALLDLRERFPRLLLLRVSMDHFRRELHEQERGRRSWEPMMRGLRWLNDNGFRLHLAGRTRWGESEPELRAGYAELFEREGIGLDAFDPQVLVLFPEMDEAAAVPEITDACWDILGIHPADMMCATSRMVVKRRGAIRPVVVSCTLLPYDSRFEMGTTLAEALRPVSLNHPHCARFCVLGGGSCSG